MKKNPRTYLKWLIPVAVFLAAALICLFFLTSRFLLVQGSLVSRNAETIDLRGKELTVQDFEQLRQELPQCDITWDVPFQGTIHSSDITTLRVESLTRGDLELLEYFPRLETLDATALEDHSLVFDYQSRHPGCEILYQVTVNGQAVPWDAEVLTLNSASLEDVSDNLSLLPRLSGIELTGDLPAAADIKAFQAANPAVTVSWETEFRSQLYPSNTLSLDLSGTAITLEEAEAFLVYFPVLESCDMTGCGLTDEEMFSLADKFYPTFFIWEMDFLGTRVSTDITDIDISGTKVSDPSEVETLLPYFPKLERLYMSNCGLDNDTMDALNRRHEDVQIIWTVYIRNYPIRTDTWYFYPYKMDPYRFPWKDALTDDQVYVLRYCTDIRSIDIGHNTSLHSIEWAAYMPELRHLIIADTPVSDLTPLVNCKKLVYLEASGCTYLKDLSPLLECTGLRDLNLGKTYHVDPAPVAQLTWLNRLWWSNVKDTYYAGSTAPTFVPDALTKTICNFTAAHPVADFWRTFQHYYDMRDIMGMFYLR